jgi:hypothetical protein
MKRVFLILTSSIAVLVGSTLGAAYYLRNTARVPDRQMSETGSPHQLNRTLDALTEYVSPYGYRFKYPSGFRLAKDYMVLRNGGVGHELVLTSASENEEKTYVTQIEARATQENISFDAARAQTDFFPDKSIDIYPEAAAFAERKNQLSEASSPQFRQAWEAKNGRKYPAIVNDIQPVTTKDGIDGIIFEFDPRSDRHFPWLQAMIPYRPITLKLAVDYVPSLNFVFTITSSSAIPYAASVLRQIVGTLEFN